MAEVFNIVTEIQNKQSVSSMKKNEVDLVSFDKLITDVKNHFDDYFKDDDVDNAKKQERLELFHLAVIGDSETEKFLTSEIDTYLRTVNISNIPYPDYYRSLAEALYHEIFRFGVLQKWYVMEDSPAAKFIGNEFWIEINDVFVKQEEELPSDDTVREFINRFQAGQKNLKVNESNPYAEIALRDQTRVTIIMPPASYKPTLIFRKYTVSNFSFDKQASFGTIPKEDIEFYKVFSNLYLNTVVAGHIKSGKSTFLKTIYGAREPEKVAVLIEGTAESFLKRDFPERLVHELYSQGEDINKVISRALRLDHDYIIVQEVRGVEAEGAIAGTERGRNGLLMSYHITDPENTPIQLAQHIVDEYPNRTQQNEITRIAKALDIGLTMESKKGRKRITSMYEIGFDIERNQPFINYLIRYNSQIGQWEYNSNISKEFRKRITDLNESLAAKFVEHLSEREALYPMSKEPRDWISLENFRR
jgi:pilus assembly protein CpaF